MRILDLVKISGKFVLYGQQRLVCLSLMLIAACGTSVCRSQQHSYAGFDRNGYPGDSSLPALRMNFQFAGYWLNNPPGAAQNGWTGKRALLREKGFGFLVLFNGRLDAELKGKDAVGLGMADGKKAVAAAAREGFPRKVIIFLDQEEGGRLLQEQADYIFAWADAVRVGGARAGVYCSGIDVPEGNGKINTAEQLTDLDKSRGKSGEQWLRIWIFNDQCPPSPGCTPAHAQLSAAVPPALKESVVAWQYARSPRAMEFTSGCPANYASDGLCYAPDLAHNANSFVDLNAAGSADPSEGR